MSTEVPAAAASEEVHHPGAFKDADGILIDVDPLRRLLKSYTVSAQQQEQLVTAWIAAKPEDRRLIGYLFRDLFRDPNFVQRIHLQLAADGAKERHATLAAGTGGGGSSTALTSSDAAQENPSRGQQRANATIYRQLRRSCDEMLCRLVGPGPFPVSFHIAESSEDMTEVINMYATQFAYPDAPALRDLVRVPKRLSTRTRKKIHGNFTWTIRAMVNGESTLACAVTVNIINAETFTFIEMPLFATASGFKKLGLARVLNAALQEHCYEIDAAFILVSADLAAIPFWETPSLGYTKQTRELKGRVQFHYEQECTKFENTELMVWSPPKGFCPDLIRASLQRTKLVVEGPQKLPRL